MRGKVGLQSWNATNGMNLLHPPLALAKRNRPLTTRMELSSPNDAAEEKIRIPYVNKLPVTVTDF